MSIFDPKYHGADVRTDDPGRDQDGAAQLRAVCREQRETIRELERDLRKLKRQLAEAQEALRLKDTLPMPARKAAV